VVFRFVFSKSGAPLPELRRCNKGGGRNDGIRGVMENSRRSPRIEGSVSIRVLGELEPYSTRTEPRRKTVMNPSHLNNTVIASYLGANKGVETDIGHDRD